MSLTRLVAQPDVAARIDAVLPPMRRQLDEPVLVRPRSQNWPLVGTAFDYMLRFELQRRYPYAVATRWIAAAAVESLWETTTNDDIARKADDIVDTARAAVDAFISSQSPSDDAVRELAAHAIRLARLDSYYRSRDLDPELDVADPRDVEDLAALHKIAPLEELGGAKPLHLNPAFGKWSGVVGGADADLIAGDRLIDVKVTNNGFIDDVKLRQLTGYLLLARAVRRDDANFPEIGTLGIYFARHGVLRLIPAESITRHAGFAELETWFFERARGGLRMRPTGLRSAATIARATGGRASLRRPTGPLHEDADPGSAFGVPLSAPDFEFTCCHADAKCRGDHSDETIGCCMHRCYRIHSTRDDVDAPNGAALRTTYAFTGLRLRCGCRQRVFIWSCDGEEVVECLRCSATWLGGPREP